MVKIFKEKEEEEKEALLEERWPITANKPLGSGRAYYNDAVIKKCIIEL